MSTVENKIQYRYTSSGRKTREENLVDGTKTFTRHYAGLFTFLDYGYGAPDPTYVSTPYGRFVQKSSTWRHETNLRDHLGNTRLANIHEGTAINKVQETHYYPFGHRISPLSNQPVNLGTERNNAFLYNGKLERSGNPAQAGEFNDDFGLNWYDYGARFYDAQIARFHSVDPHAENYLSISPYAYVGNNPIIMIDPDGRDWYDINGKITWHDHEGELTIKDQTYQSLVVNTIVATHNRAADGNEPINSATFELYLESDKTGPSASISGNTVPADISEFGTLAEGIYSAHSQGRASYIARGEEDLAVIINDGRAVPTVSGNPNKENSDMLTGIFLHKGNPFQESLKDRAGNPVWSHGCQTTGSGPGSLERHNAFMQKVGSNFKGTYYLRAAPSIQNINQKSFSRPVLNVKAPIDKTFVAPRRVVR